MIFTDGAGQLLFCSRTTPGSCADITHARELGLVRLLADGPAVEILATRASAPRPADAW